MYVTNRTVITFELPNEWEEAQQFAKEHPDWQKLEDTMFVSFIKERHYRAELKDGNRLSM